MLFPKSFGSFLFPLLATMHAGEGAGDDSSPANKIAGKGKNQVDGDKGQQAFSKGSGTTVRDSVGPDNGGEWGGSCSDGRAVRSPDERLAWVARSYGRAMRELAGSPDPEGHTLLQAALEGAGEGRRGGCTNQEEGSGKGKEGGECGAGWEEDANQKQQQLQSGGRVNVEGAGGGANLMTLMEKTRYGDVLSF